MTKTLTLTAAILGLAATPLLAETMVQDTDGNGAYSLSELVVVYPDLTPEIFGQIDTDTSGDVSEAELADAVDAGVLAAG
ncbi:hypothetical protein GCM10011360_09890 [Primorskyibacter flagellatus]|uniref:EF-hand domain-containing protein n=1 Tax=Primorskyibacter flagellatus TaxID=1387277 RepID=A0A917A2A0_9RHOB|nr:EF-hand domain-containing protein [Primorskyibacter flagellatus]GGE23366.1 hypothetical protein GCM10011360_09890 [Primorskyibacter flagellatus]